jgi:PAS domain S-box-containing protein
VNTTEPVVPGPRPEADPLAALRVGPEQLLALIDNTSAVIYMRNVDGRYMLVNREYERLFNVRREDIIGLTDHDLFPLEVADVFRANDLQAAADGRPIQVEETAPGPDGLRTYITAKFPLLDEAGVSYAVCGISTDITERKQAEAEVVVLNAELEQRVRLRTAELEASTAELGAFAYSVSHDLRSPLRALHGFSQLLLEGYSDVLDETGVGHLRRLQANTDRMAQIIDGLLRLSRAGRDELVAEPIDLAAMIAVIHRELQALEPDRPVELTFEGAMPATGDAQLMRLAVQNLMTNAWKFTAGRSPARITAGTRDRDGQSIFFIRDNGAGFEPRYAQKLFEPFQRLHTASAFEGDGIGLAIVHRVIHRHGGSIWAESAPDQGATFYFTTSAPPHDPRTSHAE